MTTDALAASLPVAADTHTFPVGWRIELLGNIARTFVSGGTPSTKLPEFWDGAIPWTTSAPIAENDVVLDKAQRFISEQGLQASASNLVPAGNLLVGTRVGVGKAVENAIDIAISQDLTGIVLDHSKVDALFLAYYFKSAQVQTYLDGRKRGTTIKGISRFDLQELPLCLPPLGEQRAIARVLRAVQDAVAARRREVALERERKAALMQQLFTKGTRGEPTKQTEIGEMPESWRVVRLGAIAQLLSGGTPSKERADWWRGTIPWASPKDLKQPRLRDVQDHITAEAAQEGSRVVPAGTVFIVVRGMILAKDVPVALTETPMAFNQDMKALIPIPSVTGEFLLYVLQFMKEDLFRLIGTSAHGTRRMGTDALDRFVIPMPPVEEQQAIGRTLHACERKVDTLEREGVLLEELFRTLLEELMSGRISTLPLMETMESVALEEAVAE